MEKEDFIEVFKKRTKQFTLRCIRVFQALPKTEEARIIGKDRLGQARRRESKRAERRIKNLEYNIRQQCIGAHRPIN